VINVFMWPTTGDSTSAERIETEHGYNVEQLAVAGMNLLDGLRLESKWSSTSSPR